MKRYSLLIVLLTTLVCAPIFAEGEDVVTETQTAEQVVETVPFDSALHDESSVLASPSQEEELFTAQNDQLSSSDMDLDLNDPELDAFFNDEDESAAK